VPSTLPIEGIEFGLLPTMIPTPTASDFKRRGPNSKQQGLPEAAYNGMLPTPTCFDATNASNTMKSTQVKEGSMHSVTLTRAMAMGMLPTPQASDFVSTVQEKNYSLRHLEHNSGWTNKMLPTPRTRDWKGCEGRRGDIPSYIEDNMGLKIGKTSQLSPQFVMEMMGFPTDWTELPFLNGETNQSKPEETQSSLK
jgi:hypothetical protein